MGVRRHAHRVLVGKHEGERPLGRPRRKWEDNIKGDIQDVGEVGMDWNGLAQNRGKWGGPLVNAVMELQFPQNVGNFLDCLRTC